MISIVDQFIVHIDFPGSGISLSGELAEIALYFIQYHFYQAV